MTRAYPHLQGTSSTEPVLSLFSGAGGLSLGFALAGLNPVLAVDIDADACATYEHNIGRVLQHDLLRVNPSALLKEAGVLPGETFALIGGPPCQGFSSAGSKDADDPRNALVFRYLQYLQVIQPRWFVFENVEGLLTSNSGRSVHQLVKELLALGYFVRLEKINAASFGVPQSRKRVILIGNRIGKDFAFPPPTHWFNSGRHHSIQGSRECPSMWDALSDLPDPVVKKGTAEYCKPPQNEYQKWLRTDAANLTLHWIKTASPIDQARFSSLRPGQTMKDLPEELWHPSYQRRANRRVSDGTPTERRGGSPAGLKRLLPDVPSKTITGAAPTEFVHPYFDRRLSLRECARLQSFPDWFEFKGGWGSIAQQIGNAVPPLLARALAERLLLEDNLDALDERTHSEGRLLGFHLTSANGMSPALEATHRYLSSLSDATHSLWSR